MPCKDKSNVFIRDPRSISRGHFLVELKKRTEERGKVFSHTPQTTESSISSFCLIRACRESPTIQRPQLGFLEQMDSSLTVPAKKM